MLRRPRRLRINSATRNLVRETKLNIEDLIYPLFIVEGENIKREIKQEMRIEISGRDIQLVLIFMSATKTSLLPTALMMNESFSRDFFTSAVSGLLVSPIRISGVPTGTSSPFLSQSEEISGSAPNLFLNAALNAVTESVRTVGQKSGRMIV